MGLFFDVGDGSMNDLNIMFNPLVFKHIFGNDKNKRFTASFLEALFDLEAGTLKDLRIINSVTIDEYNVSELDFEVVVILPNGKQVNLFLERIEDFHTLSEMFHHALLASENFKEKTHLLQTCIVKGSIFEEKKDIIIKKYEVYKKNDGLVREDRFDILMVNLMASRYDKKSIANDDFVLWKNFLKADSEKDLEIMAKDKEIFADIVQEIKEFTKNDFYKIYMSKVVEMSKEMI